MESQTEKIISAPAYIDLDNGHELTIILLHQRVKNYYVISAVTFSSTYDLFKAYT